jgi:hypothetical protein
VRKKVQGKIIWWDAKKKIGKLLFEGGEIFVYKSLGGVRLRKGMIVDFELGEHSGKEVARFAYPVESEERQIAIGSP